MILMGSAGTGKSYIIKGIKQYLGDTVRVTATTGMAAFSLNGQTIHSLIRLPCNRWQAKKLSPLILKKYQSDFKDIRWIIIDECSMLSSMNLKWIDIRLKEISGNNKIPFGGYNIILSGDFAQLPPVFGQCIYKQPESNSSSDHCDGYQLYQLFDIVIYLDELVRQKISPANKKFINFLNHVRYGKVTEHDYNYIKCRFYNNLSYSELQTFLNAVRIYQTNEECAQYNLIKLEELEQPIARINAVHDPPKAIKVSARDANGLEPVLYLCKNARVMLTINIDPLKGLANGAFGTVKYIIYNKNNNELPPNLPLVVIVQFDAYKGKPIIPAIERSVSISPITAYFTLSNDIKGKISSRQQIPLRLAWAITIHKSQGQTLDKVVIDIGKQRKIKASGLEYVAFSRVREVKDLVLMPVDWPRFRLLNKPNKIKLKEEKRLKQMFNDCKINYHIILSTLFPNVKFDQKKLIINKRVDNNDNILNYNNNNNNTLCDNNNKFVKLNIILNIHMENHIPIFRCICGKRLYKIKSTDQCIKEYGIIWCDICNQKCPRKQLFYHCKQGKNVVIHKEGFDMCLTCANAQFRYYWSMRKRSDKEEMDASDEEIE